MASPPHGIPTVLVAAALLCAPAEGLATPPRAALVAAAIGEQPPSFDHVEARLGDEVHLWAVVREGRGRRAVYYTDAPALRVGRRRVPGRRLKPLAALGSSRVHWWRVEPFQHHFAIPPPNQGNPAYSNCVLFGPRHGRWLGWDTIEYHESFLTMSGSSVVVRRAEPTDPRLLRNRGLGTMRYKVVVELADGGVLTSPGAHTQVRGGISAAVLRVSFSSGDDLVGRLHSFFNVPNVFGSAGKGRTHQTEQHQGADCADVIVGALRKAGADVPYTSATGLLRHARPVTGRLLLDDDGLFVRAEDGSLERVSLRWGEDVERGDLVLIDYGEAAPTGRFWDHVGVLAGDAGEQGVVDPEDLLLHVGYLYGLEEEELGSQGPAVVQLARWRRKVRRAIGRGR